MSRRTRASPAPVTSSAPLRTQPKRGAASATSLQAPPGPSPGSVTESDNEQDEQDVVDNLLSSPRRTQQQQRQLEETQDSQDSELRAAAKRGADLAQAAMDFSSGESGDEDDNDVEATPQAAQAVKTKLGFVEGGLLARVPVKEVKKKYTDRNPDTGPATTFDSQSQPPSSSGNTVVPPRQAAAADIAKTKAASTTKAQAKGKASAKAAQSRGKASAEAAQPQHLAHRTSTQQRQQQSDDSSDDDDEIIVVVNPNGKRPVEAPEIDEEVDEEIDQEVDEEIDELEEDPRDEIESASALSDGSRLPAQQQAQPTAAQAVGDDESDDEGLPARLDFSAQKKKAGKAPARAALDDEEFDDANSSTDQEQAAKAREKTKAIARKRKRTTPPSSSSSGSASDDSDSSSGAHKSRKGIVIPTFSVSNQYAQGRNGAGARISWDTDEENCLIEALKELYKADQPSSRPWAQIIAKHGPNGTNRHRRLQLRTVMSCKDKAVNMKQTLIRQNVKVPSYLAMITVKPQYRKLEEDQARARRHKRERRRQREQARAEAGGADDDSDDEA